MGWNNEDHYEPIKEECQYKDNCKSYPLKCSGCKKNPENKTFTPYKPSPWTTPWVEPQWPMEPYADYPFVIGIN